MPLRRARKLQSQSGASGEELLGLFLELNGADRLGKQELSSLAAVSQKYGELVRKKVNHTLHVSA